MPSEEAAALVLDAEPGSCTMDHATRGMDCHGLLSWTLTSHQQQPSFTGGVRGSKSHLLELKTLTFISESAVFITRFIYLIMELHRLNIF